MIGRYLSRSKFWNILKWNTFETLFCWQFSEKVMIDNFYLVAGLENISGNCDYLLGNEDSLLHWKILKVHIEDLLKIIEIHWMYTVNVKLHLELLYGSTENLMVFFYGWSYINATFETTRKKVALNDVQSCLFHWRNINKGMSRPSIHRVTLDFMKTLNGLSIIFCGATNWRKRNYVLTLLTGLRISLCYLQPL